ncbi:MAG: sterol desaturase family protein [Flavobacteriaceae bacterium]|nr:sterol desaturase family protein [Flavobacteriaceae bacterium]
MNYLGILISTAVSFIFLVSVFYPMEKMFPAKKGQNFFRPNWLLDFCFFIGQYFVFGALVLWALGYFEEYLGIIISQEFRTKVTAQPWWLQTIEVILLSDLCIYWFHRLQHKIPLLWRFHKVHHSAKHLDWLAAHREHPLDSIFTIGVINLPAFIFGFPLETLAGFIAFRGIWAVYIHANVRLPFPFLRKVIGAPELHHWHHDLDRDAGNYANISPLMDVIFGTYTCPDAEPESFGIKEEFPQHYGKQMLFPLLPEKWTKKTED